MYKIYLEKQEDLCAGWLGPVAGVTQNYPIYCRVTEDKAWIFNKQRAIDTVIEYTRLGYKCKCVPSITITY